MNSDSLFTNTIYSGLATFGSIYTLITSVLTTIVGLLFIGFGIYFLYYNLKNGITVVQGTVLDASTCTDSNNTGGQTPKCRTQIQFTATDSKQYSFLASGNNKYVKGDTVTVYYKADNPSDHPQLDGPMNFPTWQAALMIIGGIILIAGTWLWAWLIRMYKPLGAFAGAYGVVDVGAHLL